MKPLPCKRTWAAATPLLCLAALMLGPAPTAGAQQGEPLDPAVLCAPGGHTFTHDMIDNAYFPLPVGRQWAYGGKEQGQDFGLQVTVLDQTETLRFRRGVRVITRVVEEVEWEDTTPNQMIDEGENLIEVSLNYFAQTEDGTVCYFGEAVDIYEDGVIVSNEGAWRADERGNAPGIFMPAEPRPGMTFPQEVAPGVAADEATIVRTGGSATLFDGRVVETITVRDFNPLDGSRGTKVYASGVGLIQDAKLVLTDERDVTM
jgi:hypothetical protein